MINRPVFISMLVSIALLSPVAADPRRGEQNEARQDMRVYHDDGIMRDGSTLAAICREAAQVGLFLPGGRAMFESLRGSNRCKAACCWNRRIASRLPDGGASWPD